MIDKRLYKTSHSMEWLQEYFTKNYYKKPYDRFMWWRSYVPRNKPLTNRHPFRDRILNGDYDYSPFRLEAEIVEHRLNEKWIDWGSDDPARFIEECSLDKSRRKRLHEDFNKEEVRRLAELRKGFVIEFKMTLEDYDREVIETTSEELIDFYYEMEEKYGKYIN